MMVAVVWLFVGALSTQSPMPPRTGAPAPAGTGAISGTVQAADNHRPARRARVSLTGGDPRISQIVTTGDNGEFNFTGLPPGDFTLSVSKPGWLDSVFGQVQAGSGRPGTPIALGAGQRVERIALPMARGGVLTGLVLDEQGEPAFGTPVRAMRYVMRNGERQLTSGGATTSDDRGIYRIPGLLPGDYIVAAVPREADGAAVEEKMVMEQVAAAKMAAANASGADMAMQDIQKALESLSTMGDPAKAPTSGYAPVYYPGTTVGANATTVTLGISEEKTSIDVQLQIVPLTRVTGLVTTAEGTVPSGVQVMLFDNGQGLPGAGTRTARAGNDGRFTFTGVQQGQYTLFARAAVASPQAVAPAAPISMPGTPEMTAVVKAVMAGPANQLWAIADVIADPRNAPPVTLTLQPGMSISGTLAFDGGSAPADLSRVRLALTPFGPGAASEMAGNIRPVALDADRRFTLTGVVPGQYKVSIASSAGLNGWSMKSATAAGQDMLDVPLEIKPNESVNGVVVTMTMRPTDLHGTLQGQTGQPAADCTVVVFSSDNRYWMPNSRRIQATRPSTEGRFAFHDLPPGDYRIAAVSDVEPGAWFGSDFLRQLVGASTLVTLGEGERKTQDVRIAR